MRCNYILFYSHECQCHKTIPFALLHLLFTRPIQPTVFTTIYLNSFTAWTKYSGILLTQTHLLTHTCTFSFRLALGSHQSLMFLKWRKQCLRQTVKCEALDSNSVAHWHRLCLAKITWQSSIYWWNVQKNKILRTKHKKAIYHSLHYLSFKGNWGPLHPVVVLGKNWFKILPASRLPKMNGYHRFEMNGSRAWKSVLACAFFLRTRPVKVTPVCHWWSFLAYKTSVLGQSGLFVIRMRNPVDTGQLVFVLSVPLSVVVQSPLSLISVVFS